MKHFNLIVKLAAVAFLAAGVFVGAGAQAPEPAQIVDVGEAKLLSTDVLKVADLANAVKIVKGKPGFGDVFILLTDPQCPYCRSLHQTLKRMDNVTIYVMMARSLGPKSAEINRKVWCSADRAAAFDIAWNGGGASLQAANCNAEAIDSLYPKLQTLSSWRSVPAMYFIGGRVINGDATIAEISKEIQMGKIAARK